MASSSSSSTGGVRPFSPSPEVVQGHKLPHLTEQLALIKEPSFSYISVDTNEYLWSVSRFAIILAALSWLCVFLFYLSLCIRCCFKYTKRCFRCWRRCCRGQRRGGKTIDEIPEEVHDEAEAEAYADGRLTLIETMRKRVSDHNRCRSCLMQFNYALCLILVVASGTVFKGDAGLSDAFKAAESAISLISELFSQLCQIATVGLSDAQSIVASLLPGGSCDVGLDDSEQAALELQAQSIANAMEGIADLSRPLTKDLQYGISGIQAADAKKTNFFVAFFCLNLLLALLFVSGTYCRSSCSLRISSLLAALLVLSTSLLASLAMASVTLLGDFCLSPSSNLVSLFPVGSPTRQDLEYFLYCSGTNPFQTQIDIASAALHTLNTTLQAEIAHPSNPPLSARCTSTLQAEVTSVFNSLASLEGLVSCVPVFELYDAAVQQSLCNDGTSGVYNVMVVFFTSAFLLYLAMCTSSVFYHWYLRPDQEEQSGGGGLVARPRPGAGGAMFGDTELGGHRLSSGAGVVHSVSPPSWARDRDYGHGEVQAPFGQTGGQRRIGQTSAQLHKAPGPGAGAGAGSPSPFGNPWGSEEQERSPASASFTIRPGAATGSGSGSGVGGGGGAGAAAAEGSKPSVTFEL